MKIRDLGDVLRAMRENGAAGVRVANSDDGTSTDITGIKLIRETGTVVLELE